MTINMEGKAAKYGMPTAALTIIAAVFAAGMSFAGLVGHRTNEEVHMTESQYNEKFDARLSLHVAPFLAHNQACAVNFTRIETEQKSIKTEMTAIMTWLIENK